MKVIKVGVSLAVQRVITDRWHSADSINPLDEESPDPKEIAADPSIYSYFKTQASTTKP